MPRHDPCRLDLADLLQERLRLRVESRRHWRLLVGEVRRLIDGVLQLVNFGHDVRDLA